MHQLNQKKKVENFRNWLSAHGASVLDPTNQYEVIRFKAGCITSIVYRNEKGRFTFTGESQKAYNAFCNADIWKAQETVKRTNKSNPVMRRIRNRDGNLCFFCNKEVSQEEETREHLVNIIHGGTNHISNLFLAHQLCNQKAGCLSAPEKIKIHDKAILQSQHKED